MSSAFVIPPNPLVFPSYQLYNSFSPQRSPYTSFPISHQRLSYIAAWSVDAGVPLPMITRSGGDYAPLKGGIGIIPLHGPTSNPQSPNLRSTTQTTKEWATRI